MREWTEDEINALIDAKVKARRFTANDIVTFIGAAGTILTALLTLWLNSKVNDGNHKISAVNDRQVVHEQKTEEVKAALNVETQAVNQKLDKIENRIQAVGLKPAAK